MITILDEQRAIAACVFSTDLAVAFKELEGKREWRRKGGYQFEPSGRNIELVRAATGLDVIDLRENDPPEGKAPPHRDPYQERTLSFEHQRQAAAAMEGRTRFALFAEAGTGKSKMAIDACGRWYAENKIDAVLIVAPKGVDRQWLESQFTEHYGGKWRGAFWTGKNKPDDIVHAYGCLSVFAIGYDALKTQRGFDFARAWLRAAGRFALVLDESHYIKNAQSQRWRACDKVRRDPMCTATLLLTGTPIARNLIDEWSQLKVLDADIIGIKYVTMFRREFCIMGGFEGREVIGTRNLDRFKERTAPFVFRARKSDLDIPPKLYSEFVFDMTPRQKRLYKEMAADLITLIDNNTYVTAANAAVAVNKLQQISNGHTQHPDEPTPRDLFETPDENPRVAALCQFLDAREGQEKTIIWCRYLHDVATLLRVDRFRRAAVLSSQVTAAERAAAIENWLSDGEPYYLIGTPGTGGTGLNLQGACRTVIYYSNSENSVQRWQSEDRVHRIGTTHKVNYVDLIARGSRDRAILANLKAKRNLSDLRLDDLRDDLVATILWR